jgi:PPK2 family polyphosphate:nucleotide phosphotransferase
MTTNQTQFATTCVPLGVNAAPAEPTETASGPDSDLIRMLMVEPGSNISLGSIDPDFCQEQTYQQALPAILAHIQKIDRLQYLMHAEGKHSLLIVLQGLDACGKDGVVRHILSGVNSAGCRVAAFKQPTSTERAHDFLWRVHPHAPAKGEIAVFNRSHYEDVLVARVHHLASETVWARRYRLINEFENLLTVENDTTVLKFFLHISKEEQLARFKRRLEDPWRRWKISEADYQEREHWDEYIAAFEEMLHNTSTWHAPWFVVPANNKWFRDLAVSQIIARTLEDLDMKLPAPSVDLAHIRRRYHTAEVEAIGEPETRWSPQKKQRALPA